MTRGMHAAAALFIALWAALAPIRPAFAQVSGPMPRDIRIEPHLGAAVPEDIELTDESGQKTLFGDHLHRGRPVIVVLAYYECPMLCSMVLNGLVNALKRGGLTPGEDFDVVVASIDPSDTPARASAKKEAYVKLYDRTGAEHALHFMTGAPAEVKRLADAVGFKYEYDPIGRQFAHAAGVMVLTPQGIISRYFYGVDFSPRDLRLGLVEAGGGAVGTVGDRLLLLCYHYDPEQGKYGALTMRAVRAGGALTILLLGASLVLMRRKGRGAGPEGGAAGKET